MLRETFVRYLVHLLINTFQETATMKIIGKKAHNDMVEQYGQHGSNKTTRVSSMSTQTTCYAGINIYGVMNR
jgi:hypothetical protein